MSEPRRTGRSAVALLAGFALVVALSLGTDAVMHATGVLPPFGEPATDFGLGIALVYRTLYGIAGSYLTARLAPYQAMTHSLISGAVGFVLSVIGAMATWNAGPAFGPHWYPLALIATTLPGAWAGGKLFEIQRRVSRGAE